MALLHRFVLPCSLLLVAPAFALAARPAHPAKFVELEATRVEPPKLDKVAEFQDVNIPMEQLMLITFVGLLVLAVLLSCCSYCKTLPCVRSMPIEAGFYFMLSLAGFVLSDKCVENIGRALHQMEGLTEIADAVGWMNVSFLVLLLVNVLVLAMALMGAGCFRECIFGARSEALPGCLRCCQILLGPVAMGYATILLWITFMVQLFLSHVFIVAAVIVLGASSVCHAGRDAIESAQYLLDDTFGKQDFHFDDAMCRIIEDFGTNKLLLCACAALTVVSQAGMLKALASKLVMAENEMRKEQESASDVAEAGAGPPAQGALGAPPPPRDEEQQAST